MSKINTGHKINTSRFGRRTALGLLGAATAGVAAGCSDDYRQVDGAVPAKYTKRQHLVAWHSFSSATGEALVKMVDAFNSSQSEIFVEPQYQGSYEETQQKLSAAIIARQIPDLTVLSEVTWRAMHLADALEPLEGYFDDELKPEDYIEQFITEGTVKDHVWWLPFARSTPLFYFNRSVYAKAGLPDRAPKTWDEFAEWAPEIRGVKTAAGQVMPLALDGGYSAWYFQGNMWQWNARYSDGLDILLDSPEGIAAATWMADFVHKKKAGYLSAKSSIDFGNQAASAALMSTASLAQTTELATASKFDLGTGFMPEHESFGCPTGGSGWGIMANAPTARKQAAFQFLKFLGKPENSATWTMATGYLPIVKKAQQDPRLVELVAKDPNFSTSLKQLPKTKTQDLARLVIPDASNFMDDAFETLYSSNIAPERFVGQLAKKMRRKAELLEENYRAHYE
ncbi:ABC transporter substrate-binding protein [Microlunatus soli]|uniref:Carbohydrate ABC transporter substrate-binding protein, CUT1 family n=1 Tax=Microlunatus soli TaxID=630515 RepID=A0A1H1QMN6_9ACTN|nr:ABC transporter substrate-binding protein [Microlunatus soli]SDS24718.1 carbohydrate ABC transporter substrate-binding protein, CUT1 family [Microlunatus soli]